MGRRARPDAIALVLLLRGSAPAAASSRPGCWPLTPRPLTPRALSTTGARQTERGRFRTHACSEPVETSLRLPPPRCRVLLTPRSAQPRRVGSSPPRVLGSSAAQRRSRPAKSQTGSPPVGAPGRPRQRASRPRRDPLRPRAKRSRVHRSRSPHRPHRFYQQPSRSGVARLRDPAAVLLFPRAHLPRHQPEVRLHLMRASKTRGLVQRRSERDRRHNPHAGRRAQTTNHRIRLRSLGEPIVGSMDLFVELLHHGQQRCNLGLQPLRKQKPAHPRHKTR